MARSRWPRAFRASLATISWLRLSYTRPTEAHVRTARGLRVVRVRRPIRLRLVHLASMAFSIASHPLSPCTPSPGPDPVSGKTSTRKDLGRSTGVGARRLTGTHGGDRWGRHAPRTAREPLAAGGCRGPRRWRRGCTLGRTGSRDAGAGLRADGVCAEPPSAGAPPSCRAPSVTADTHNLPQTGLVSFCEKQLPREST